MKTPRFVKITNIDFNGYLGRDHHPRRTDAGTVVQVNLVTHEPEPDDTTVAVYTCTRRDGTPVYLIDHEIEDANLDKWPLVPGDRIDERGYDVCATMISEQGTIHVLNNNHNVFIVTVPHHEAMEDRQVLAIYRYGVNTGNTAYQASLFAAVGAVCKRNE